MKKLVKRFIMLALRSIHRRRRKMLLPRSRGSQRLSRLARPLLENHRRIRLIVGANLAGAIVFVGSLGPVGGSTSLDQPEVAVLNEQTIQVLTETTFRFPLETNEGFSQGFYRFHPGVDIRAPLGSNVYAIASGTVVEVEIARFGYGHKVVIEHQNGLTSLYAHLGTVNVRSGDTVAKDTILGVIGLTGWTTGPHLHLEIHTPSGVLNPKQVLPDPISS